MFKVDLKQAAAKDIQDGQDFIGMNDGNQGDGDELEKLRTENKRLKRTLMERFDQTFK